MKLKVITFFLLVVGINSFAQKLNPKEKTVFDDIAYTKLNTGPNAVVLKWVMPIRYKIYGDSTEYILKEIDTTFKQLRKLTQLDIQQTNDDDEANFILVFGKQEKDLQLLSPDSEKYRTAYGSFYFRSNNKSEIFRAESLFSVENYNYKADIRTAIKRNIIKSLGFLNSTQHAPNSLFYASFNNKLKIDDFDGHIITTFYLPTIKAGMDKTAVDEILK
jgi:hypothetical protein